MYVLKSTKPLQNQLGVFTVYKRELVTTAQCRASVSTNNSFELRIPIQLKLAFKIETPEVLAF